MRALLTLSMKGGVGKTTTAIGLARALQREDYRVGLLTWTCTAQPCPARFT